MYKVLKQIRESQFLRHNAIFFFGALAAGLLNYLFYPIIGRLLNPSSFGEVQALFSLFAQINIFLTVLGLLTVNIVVNTESAERRNQIIIELEKLALVAAAVLIIISLFAAGSLEHFFHFDSPLPFIALAVAVFAAIPITFRLAYLRGQKGFALVSVLTISLAASELILSVLFVLLGWKTTGVMLSLIIAQFLIFLYAAWLARRRGFSGSQLKTLFKLPDMRVIKPELRYAFFLLISSLTITGLYSIDTVVMKHWFDAHTAGLYAGIATVARIIFFITASITLVMLPSVRMKHTKKQNHQVLMKSLVLLVGIGGFVLLVFSIKPDLVIHMLMGASFLPLAHLLPRLSLVIFIISILNLIVLYHMALRQYAVSVIVVLGALVTALIMATNHQTPLAVVNSLLYGSIVIGSLLCIWSIVRRVRETPDKSA